MDPKLQVAVMIYKSHIIHDIAGDFGGTGDRGVGGDFPTNMRWVVPLDQWYAVCLGKEVPTIFNLKKIGRMVVSLITYVV